MANLDRAMKKASARAAKRNPLRGASKSSRSSKSKGGTAFGPKGTKVPKKYAGKSTKLGSGGRAAKLKAAGVPGGVIGNIARRKQAAPGQKNFHRGR